MAYVNPSAILFARTLTVSLRTGAVVGLPTAMRTHSRPIPVSLYALHLVSTPPVPGPRLVLAYQDTTLRKSLIYANPFVNRVAPTETAPLPIFVNVTKDLKNRTKLATSFVHRFVKKAVKMATVQNLTVVNVTIDICFTR
jgi:hypothetical protein